MVVNALPYKKKSSGIGGMIRDLYGAYAKITRRPCQVIVPQDAPEFADGGRSEVIRIPYNHADNLRRLFFQAFSLGRLFCRESVLLTTDSKCPFFLPKTCVLVPLVTDLAVWTMPEVYRFERVFLWRLQYFYVRRRAVFFLAISEFTKQEMVRLLSIPPEKIYVVPCACSPEFAPIRDMRRLKQLKQRYGIDRQFILFVGNLNPRKNLKRLINAFDLAKTEGNLPHLLVIAGDMGWKFNKEEALRDIRNKEDVRFIGFVPEEDMPALYSAAALFAFPTLYEGFGIPVLEAQACGVPVLTSGCSALPEVCGEGALYVDPCNERDIAHGIMKILNDEDLSNSLVRQGLENVRRFSWESSARRLNEIIEEKIPA